MAKAHAEDRKRFGRGFEQGEAQAGLVGRAWPRGKNNALESHPERVRNAQGVVSHDKRFRAKILDIVDQVVDKTVIIIDHEDHGGVNSSVKYSATLPRPP
jgi:hypothetical protein